MSEILFATECGCLFKIIKETPNFYLVEWIRNLSIYNKTEKLMIKNILKKSDAGKVIKTSSFEEYCRIFGPDANKPDVISSDYNFKKYQELMSRFSNEERDFIVNYIGCMSQPRG